MKKNVMRLALLTFAVLMLLPTFAAAAELPTNPFYARAINQGSAIGRESVGWENTGTGSLGYLTWESAGATDTLGTKNAVQEVHVSQQGVGLAADGSALDALQELGPHSNYAINTIKCATCHSVHIAPQDSWLLTQATGSAATAAEVCALCHNALTGTSTTRVSTGPTAKTGNHSHNGEACTSTVPGAGCHGGVHGVGVSKYDTLAKSLLNAGADPFVDYAIAETANTGLTADYFDLADNGIDAGDKNTFAVSYLCTMCHQGSAFATVDGMSMWAADPGNQKTLSAYAPASQFLTSHPMLSTNATATTDWSKAGATFSGQIAFADSVGCISCHRKVDPNTGKPMFPHSTNSFAEYGNIDLGGTDPVTLAINTDDPKGIWLETASYLGAADTQDVFRADAVTYDGAGAAGAGSRWGGAQDGVCLNCHRTGDETTATAGVGITF